MSDEKDIKKKLRARVEHYRNLAKSNRDMVGSDDFTPNRGAAEAFEHVVKEIEAILDGKG